MDELLDKTLGGLLLDMSIKITSFHFIVLSNALCIATILIHPSEWDVTRLDITNKKAMLSVPPEALPQLFHGVFVPVKRFWHLQIAWQWNHITVFRFQFYSLGKYCFKPLLFIKKASYSLCAAIVLCGPCLWLRHWDCGRFTWSTGYSKMLNAFELSMEDCNRTMRILKWFLHAHFIINLGAELHQILYQIHLIKWSYAEMVSPTKHLSKAVYSESLGYCDLPHCLRWISSSCGTTGIAPMIRAHFPFIFAASLSVQNAANYSSGGLTLL